jgi:hypothetical protein
VSCQNANSAATEDQKPKGKPDTRDEGACVLIIVSVHLRKRRLEGMVSPERLERSTHALKGRCSTN